LNKVFYNLQAQIIIGYIRAVLKKREAKCATRETHIQIHHTDYSMPNVVKTGAAKRAGPSSIYLARTHAFESCVQGRTAATHIVFPRVHTAPSLRMRAGASSARRRAFPHGLFMGTAQQHVLFLFFDFLLFSVFSKVNNYKIQYEFF
jgi:hypothetical protein